MQLISFTTFFVIKRILGILKDKTFITNDELEKRLLKKYDKQIPQTTLFEV